MSEPLFDAPGPRWFTIPSHRPFVEDLARGLLLALGSDDPMALAGATVLTPTRRGARALADAFVTVAEGRAVLPPQIRPLGDLDEGEAPFEPGDLALDLPPAIEPLRRRFELLDLVKANEALLGRTLEAGQALEVADALGGFVDSLQIEEVDAADRLDGLVAAEMAEHWAVTRDFLETSLKDWRERLAGLGLVDVSERRVALLRRLARQWSENPPPGVLIAAGSTGSAPATADLLGIIAAAPRGAVVLPGLDVDLAEAAWRQVDEQHPQGTLRRLLARLGIERRSVRTWPGSPAYESRGRWRRRIVNEALRPAERTADWLGVISDLREEGTKAGVDPLAEGLEGVSLVSAAGEDQAATICALLLREALETPGRTAALVTPDQELVRRVRAVLGRWGVEPDSSAGEPLSASPCGVLAGLVLRLLEEPLSPVPLLALLKHADVHLGLGELEFTQALRELELQGLRGARPADWGALETRLAAWPQGLDLCRRAAGVLAALEQDVAPDGTAAADAARALARAMECLAADAQGSAEALWSGAGGECLGRLISGVIRESQGLPPVTRAGFCDLFRRLMAAETVRCPGASHPQIRILGAIEARLIRADRLVLAGLEEGVWPAGAGQDPFLSRPMRERLGLPPPERRVGLSAHDFAQAACAPEVILVYSERRGGSPSVKSRWLWRLETLARGAGLSLPGRPEAIAWAEALDAASEYAPARRPAPRPPLEARPSRLYVTRMEALTRDPYSVWARDILKLRALDPPDAPVESRARGTAIHKAFERFALTWPEALPDNGAAIFEGFYLEALRSAGMPPASLARELALAREAADWVMALEARRRADGRKLFVELDGGFTLRLSDGSPFELRAKADRIELDPQGFGHVLDYKTGSAPSQKAVDVGFSPQLTLTGAILARGGFTEIGRARPGELLYLRVTGRRPAGEVVVRATAGEESEAACDKALAGAIELLEAYRDPERAYPSRTAPQFVRLYASDYDHLARVFEWSTSGEETME